MLKEQLCKWKNVTSVMERGDKMKVMVGWGPRKA
jgi:hypothetical protein